MWLSRALETLQQLEKDNKHVSLAIDVDDEIIADRSKASKALKDVREVRITLACQILSIHADIGSLLRLLRYPRTSKRVSKFFYLSVFCRLTEMISRPTKASRQVGTFQLMTRRRLTWYQRFQDIVSCATILSQPAASSSKSEAPLPPLDLLVDVLIAYLDKASSDLKSLASLVFGLLSSEVQPSTIEHLIAVRTTEYASCHCLR